MHNTMLLAAVWALFLSGACARADDPAGTAGERQALEQARLLFYSSVEDKRQIEPAIAAFEELIRMQPEWEGRARTYLGALAALKGKHSRSPYDKWRWANRGLKMMDAGVRMDPEDIEALFIHSSTCYFLPFFFHRGEDAQAKFRTLIRLLPEKHAQIDHPLLANVINFIAERAHLEAGERLALERLRQELQLDPGSHYPEPAEFRGDS